MPATRAAGLGRALKEGRLLLGKSLEEASRDTRIRPEYLQALEREAWAVLKGDVYTRASLRSYASYLGLDPDRVLAAYVSLSTGTREDVPAKPIPEPVQTRGLKRLRRTGNWPVALGLAVVALGLLGGLGLLSPSAALPHPAAVPGATPTGLLFPPIVTGKLVAAKPVRARVIADGTVIFQGLLRKGEEVEFPAAISMVRVTLARGRTVDLVINGHDLGLVGSERQPYSAAFVPQNYGVDQSNPAS